MSIQNFVPQVWAASLLDNLNDQHVFKKCTNQDYEGEISDFGSSVKITSIGRITISNYTRNTDISAPEELDLAAQMLLIDTGKYFNFGVDDVDKRQARGQFVDAAMTEASWGLADACDDVIGAAIQAQAALTVTAATVGNGAGEKLVYDSIVEMGLALDETNTPEGNRWVVIPPWAYAMLKLDERFTGFGTDKSRAIIRGEPVGMVDNFTVYKSNNVPRDSAEYSFLAGYKGAVTFAEQVVKTEAYRPQLRFGDAVKGLHIYGTKVIRPSNVVRFDATRGTLSA